MTTGFEFNIDAKALSRERSRRNHAEWKEMGFLQTTLRVHEDDKNAALGMLEIMRWRRLEKLLDAEDEAATEFLSYRNKVAVPSITDLSEAGKLLDNSRLGDEDRATARGYMKKAAEYREKYYAWYEVLRSEPNNEKALAHSVVYTRLAKAYHMQALGMIG